MEAVERIPQHGQLGLLARMLVEALKDGKPGDIKTDEELSRVCGKSTAVGGDGYQALRKAMRYSAQVFKVNWKRMPKANAIKVLNSSETAEEVSARLTGVRGFVKRTGEKATTVRTDELTQQEKSRFWAVAAQLGAIKLCADSGTTKKLEARKADENWSATKTLELFQ